MKYKVVKDSEEITVILEDGGIACIRELDETIEVAIETTPGWYWIYDCLEGEGFKVKLSHQLKTEAIAYAKVKTDKTRGYWRPRGDSNPRSPP